MSKAKRLISPTKFSVRRLQKEEINDIETIERLCFLHPWNAYTLYKCISIRHHNCRVILHQNEVVGYVIYKVSRKTGIQIIRLAVAPGFHRRGAGRRLIDSLQRLVVDIGSDYPGCRELSIDVSEWELWVHRFLHACEFEVPANGVFEDDGQSYYHFVRVC